MAASKDGCGVGEVAAGNGRRLHLGIPEAVFVVSGQRVLDATLLFPFFLAPHPGLGCWRESRWAQLPGRGRSGLNGLNWGGTCLGGGLPSELVTGAKGARGRRTRGLRTRGAEAGPLRRTAFLRPPRPEVPTPLALRREAVRSWSLSLDSGETEGEGVTELGLRCDARK